MHRKIVGTAWTRLAFGRKTLPFEGRFRSRFMHYKKFNGTALLSLVIIIVHSQYRSLILYVFSHTFPAYSQETPVICYSVPSYLANKYSSKAPFHKFHNVYPKYLCSIFPLTLGWFSYPSNTPGFIRLAVLLCRYCFFYV